MVRSLGVGRFLEWGALDARGATGGVVVFWDNRVFFFIIYYYWHGGEIVFYFSLF